MEKSTRRLSLKRIISNDYTAGFSIVLVPSCWIMHMFLFQDQSFEELSFLATIIGIPVFVWRIHLYQVLYERGVEISGTIAYIGLYSRGNRLEYEYTFQNRKYRSGNALQRDVLRKRKYNLGDEVVLLVDPEKPKRAVIKDIYF